MKLDKMNVIIGLLLLLVAGLLFQNRKLNQRLDRIEDEIEESISYSEEASQYAEEAARNSFGRVCNDCPEDLRYY